MSKLTEDICSQVNKNEYDHQALFFKAYSAFEHHDYKKCLEYLEMVISRFKSSSSVFKADALYLQARAFVHLGLRTEAQQSLQAALEAGFLAIHHLKQEMQLKSLYSEDQWFNQIEVSRQNLVKARSIKTQAHYKYSAIPEDSEIDSKVSFLWEHHLHSYYQQLQLQANIKSSPQNLSEAMTIVGTYVQNLWSHRGDLAAENMSSLEILEAAQAGKSFRCLEYAQLFSDLMTSFGFYSRPLYLFTEKMSEPTLGQSHVVSEVFNNKTSSWQYVDVQWGLIPEINNDSCDFFQLHNTINIDSNLKFLSWSQPSDSDTELFYKNWISDYLVFFGAHQNQKPSIPFSEKKEMLFLAPLGTDTPSQFQGGDLPWTLIPTSMETLIKPPLIRQSRSRCSLL